MNLTLRQYIDGIESGKFTQQEVYDAYMKKSKEKNPELNAYISFNEQPVADMKETTLKGAPIAIKDNFLVKWGPVTCASKILEGFVATYDATTYSNLVSNGGALLGKTNLDEFAMGASNETSYFGPVLNPYDQKRVPGGSSGGSAAAVAARHCIFALGSDTGGSIRQPAAFCGVVGFKPSYGQVSRNGLMALSSSLDQIGPLTNSVEDTAIVFNSISDQDQDDMTNIKSKKIDIDKLKDPIKDKVGLPKDYYELSIDQEIKDSFKDALQKLKEAGIKTKEVDLSFMDEALAVYYIIQPAEASTNLARYDGIRYGFNKKDAKNLLDTYLKNRDSGFGKEVKRRIMIGTYVLSEGYRDAYYNTAKKVQADIKFRFQEIFKDIDAIILPTTPSVAFKLKEKFNDPLTMYLADIFTVAVNIAGLPAISLPMSKKPLSIGLQVIGNFMDEQTVLNIAYQIEQMYRLVNS